MRHRRARNFEQRQHDRGEHRARRLREERAREQIRRPGVLGEDDELRADHGGEDAAGKHPGDGLGPKLRARRIGGGEAIGLMRRRVEAAAQRADQQQPERSVQHRRARDQAGQHAEGRAGLQGKAPAVGLRQHADRQRPDPHARDHDADRQRRESGIGRQHRTDDAGGRHDDGVVAAGQRLRHAKDHGIARGKPVVDEIECGFGDDRHGRLPVEPVVVAGADGRRHCAGCRSARC